MKKWTFRMLSAAGPGAEHPDSILSGGEQRIDSDTHWGRDARKKSRLNPAATDSDKPGREGGREEIQIQRQGVGWLFNAAVISRVLFCFVFSSTYSLYTTSRRFALWEHSCQEWANRCGIRRKTTNKQSQKALGGRVLRCVSGPVGLLPFTTWKPAAFCCVSFYFLLPRIHSGDLIKKKKVKKKVRLSCFYFLFLQFCRFVIPRTKVFCLALHFCNSSYVQKHPPTHKCI